LNDVGSEKRAFQNLAYVTLVKANLVGNRSPARNFPSHNPFVPLAPARYWRSVKSIRRNRPRAQVALKNANKQFKAVLSRWETAYNKENFYRGIRILLELQRNGCSAL
jgi:hypothetical protein